MLTRILSTIKKIMKKSSKDPSSKKREDVLEDILEGHFFEIVIRVRSDGEFIVSTDISDETEESAFIVGATLYMLNSGVLSEYFLEALSLEAESKEVSVSFVDRAIEEWKTLVKEASKKENQKSILPAVSPADVFGIRKVQ